MKSGDIDWLCIDHHVSDYSHRDLTEVARAIRSLIDARWDEHGGYNDVVLAGHSAGAILVRAAYLLGKGALAGDRIDSTAWASRVSRIVLFAGISRGFEGGVIPFASRSVDRIRPYWFPKYTFQSLVRGSAFLTNVRLSWLDLLKRDVRMRDTLELVQLIGTRDDLVTSEDSEDALLLTNSWQISVPEATHFDILRIDRESNSQERYAEIRKAFLDVPRSSTRREGGIDSTTTDVVILLHGIRAGITGWEEPLKASIEKTFVGHARVIQPAYGYFTALQFTSDFQRQQYVPWFLDEYVRAKESYPNAHFHMVAHSNGVFILGQALMTTPALRFENVYLAGSVLPTDFNWQRLRDDGQVSKVVNVAAESDLPVAVLANAVRAIGGRGVGTSGFDGFNGSATEFETYVVGGHGAALDPSRDSIIATFLKSGEDPCAAIDAAPVCHHAQSGHAHTVLANWSRATPGLVYGVLGTTGYFAARFTYHNFDRPFDRPDWRRVGVLALSYGGVRWILSVL